jgi:hypothetical protein
MTEVVANSFMMLGGRANGMEGGGPGQGSGGRSSVPEDSGPEYHEEIGPVGDGEDSDVPF